MAGLASLGILAAMIGTPASADNSVRAPFGAIAVSGTIGGGGDLLPRDVFAFAEPMQSIEVSADRGDVENYYQLPEDDIRTSGSHYTITMDPSSLPAATMTAQGLVNLQMLVQSPNSGKFGVTYASVQAVYDKGGALTWKDPITSAALDETKQAALLDKYRRQSLNSSNLELLSKARGVTANVSAVMPGDLCENQGCADATPPAGIHKVSISSATGDDASSGLHAAVGVSPMDSCPPGGAGNVKTKTKNVGAWIGTGYPLFKDTSWFSFSNDSSDTFYASFGIANDAVGYWQSEQSEEVNRGFGFDWDRASVNRAYKVSVIYQLTKHYYDRCPPEAPYFKDWTPIGYTGGVGQQHITRPAYTYCAKIRSSGTWWRQKTNGTTYQESAGVKSIDFLGIDMKSTRAYDQQAKLAYHITAGRDVCGNNTYPSSSGKVEERLGY